MSERFGRSAKHFDLLGSIADSGWYEYLCRSNTDSNSYANTNSHSNTYGDTNSDTYGNSNTNRNSDTNSNAGR